MAERKLFGEFLIDGGYISERQLLDALIEQMKSLPTWPELIRAKTWMSESYLLKIFATQTRDHLDFRSAAIQCGLWSKEIDEKAEIELQKIRSPLGHILVRKGLLTLDRLSELLGEYKLGASKETADLPSKAEILPFPKPEESRGLTGSLPFEVEFFHVEGPVVGEYVELLNDDKRSEIEKTILHWESSSGETLEESLRNMYREYHTIKGSARFLKAQLTEKLIHETEEILSLSTRFVAKLSPQDFGKLTSLNLAVCDLIWELRDSLQMSGSEKEFWSALERQQRYREHFADLLKFHSELENRDYSVDLDAIKDAF